MTGKPEHRSLDEVKRLLRSLEDSPADEPKSASASLSPEPEAKLPSPKPEPKLQAVALAPVRPVASPPKLTPNVALQPPASNPSARLLTIAIVTAAGIAGVAGAMLWQSADSTLVSRTTADSRKLTATSATSVSTPVTAPTPTSVAHAPVADPRPPQPPASQLPVTSSTAAVVPSLVQPSSTASGDTIATASRSTAPQPEPSVSKPGVDSTATVQSVAQPISDTKQVAIDSARKPEPTSTAIAEPVQLAQAISPADRGAAAALTPTPPASPKIEIPPQVTSPAAPLPPPVLLPPVVAPPKAAEPKAAPAPVPAPAVPGMADPNQRHDDAEIAKLIASGRSQLDSGHVATARLLFRRAAEAGSGEAARLLGDTYDPAKLYAMGVRGTSGDMERAIHWYERADELGDALAKARLAPLGAR